MSEIKHDMVVEALKTLAQMDAQVYRKFKQSVASGNGGASPVTVPSSGARGREQLRKNLAPELFRYMRRSGRFGSMRIRGRR